MFCLVASYGQPKNNIIGWKKYISAGLDYYKDSNDSIKANAYANACILLGDYYYQEKKYEQAIKAYRNLADFSETHDDDFSSNYGGKFVEKYSIALEKVGLMYFNGIGMKKDASEALYYLNRHPNHFMREKRLLFSTLFFSNQISYIKFSEKQADTILKLAINPFLIYDTLTAADVASYIKIELKNKVDFENDSLTILVYGYGMSEYGLSLMQYFCAATRYRLATSENSKLYAEVEYQTALEYKVQGIYWPSLVILRGYR